MAAFSCKKLNMSAFASLARMRLPQLASRGAAALVLATSACTFSAAASPKVSKSSGLALAASVAPSPDSPVEKAKRAAARMAVDEYVTSGMVVGVGSGSTIVYGIQRLAERYYSEGLDVICVPTSFQSRQVCESLRESSFKLRSPSIQLIIQAGLPLSDLTINSHLDVAIDGADEVDEHLNAIKGALPRCCQTALPNHMLRRQVVVLAKHRRSWLQQLLIHL